MWSDVKKLGLHWTSYVRSWDHFCSALILTWAESLFKTLRSQLSAIHALPCWCLPEQWRLLLVACTNFPGCRMSALILGFYQLPLVGNSYWTDFGIPPAWRAAKVKTTSGKWSAILCIPQSLLSMLCDLFQVKNQYPSRAALSNGFSKNCRLNLNGDSQNGADGTNHPQNLAFTLCHNTDSSPSSC